MKDRELTQQKILQAVDNIIANDGFERLGVNVIAQKAGVSKMLIYRYFGGLDDLIAQYLLSKDYWANTDIRAIDGADVAGSLKRMFREQIIQLRNDVTLRRLCRWELTTDNENIRQLRDRRERNGCELIKAVSGFTHSHHTEVAALATILSASISYLVLIEEQSPTYNGINLQGDEGWAQVIKGIDLMIDLWIKQVDELTNGQVNQLTD